MGQKDISEKILVDYNDVTKYWKKGETAIAIYGIENQIKVEKNMPFRMIGYDGAAYRGQLLDKGKALYRLRPLCYTLVQRKDGVKSEQLKNW